MKLNIFKFIQSQKQKLIQQIPELEYYFIDIYHPSLKSKIPFLPIRAFRDFHIFTAESEGNTKTFLSSGSTNSVRAQHTFTTNGLNVYARESCKNFNEFLKKFKLQDYKIISLVPSRECWPNSSLSAMLEMFDSNDIPIKWCAKEKNFLSLLQIFSPEQNLIIFGTTFHHLSLIKYFNKKQNSSKIKKIFSSRKITIIDTGGTKGRTREFETHEIDNIFQEFYSYQKTRIFSEYGMCELGSQAWSANDLHDGNFTANSTLTPLAIDLQNNEILLDNEHGFLGFIDEVNQNSYPAIITEDIGKIVSSDARVFKLDGRSLNASVKGCSLNVKTLHLEIADNPNDEKIQSFSKKLNSEYWNANDLDDLKHSLQSLERFDFSDINTHSELKNCSLKSKNIRLIAAANTPIAFVYPLIIAGVSGAKSFTLQLPSLRINDPLSAKIRNQIIDLFKSLVSFFPNTNFYLSHNKSLSDQFENADCIMVFGTDETVQLLKEKAVENVEFWGFGDIKNSILVSLQEYTPAKLADLCSTWNGRGCLTPVVLFVEKDWTTAHTKNFFEVLSLNMKERLQNYKTLYLHDHARLHVTAKLKSLLHKKDLQFDRNSKSRNLYSQFSVVVDLTELDISDIKNFKVDFEFAGSGFVYIIPAQYKDLFPNLSTEDIFPRIENNILLK